LTDRQKLSGPKKDMVARALRLLAEKPATQVREQPLTTCLPLIARGHAEIVRRWTQETNGKLWHCEEIAITEAGREHLRKSTSG
jgi:hypothetical protein